jgi:hypothetical protein
MPSKLRSSAPLLVSILALGIAVGSTSLVSNASASAVQLITGKDVKDSSLTGKDVKDGSLLASDFKSGQLPTGAQGPKGDKGDPGVRAQVIGADVLTSITGVAGLVPVNSCFSMDLPLSGAQVGDVPLLAFVGATPVPAGLTFQVLKVSAANDSTLRLCNPTNSASPVFTDVGLRVILFR